MAYNIGTGDRDRATCSKTVHERIQEFYMPLAGHDAPCSCDAEMKSH